LTVADGDLRKNGKCIDLFENCFKFLQSSKMI
jgi:hypothetical protein